MSADALLAAARAARPDLDRAADLATPLLADAAARKALLTHRLLARLGATPGPGCRVLDAGAGRGRVLALLGALHPTWRLSALDDFGDPSHAATDPRPGLARLGVAVHAHDLSAVPWPLEDGALDLLLCFDTLEHLHGSWRPVLAEARRVLAPGGVCVLGVPNAVALHKRLRVLAGRTNLPRFDVFWDAPGPWRGHVREAAPGELRRALALSGFAPTAEIGLDCELPARLGRLYPLYAAAVACAPAQLAEVLFCAGRAP